MHPVNFVMPQPMPWYRWIGPWPFRPVVTFILASYFFLVSTTGIVFGQGQIDPLAWFSNWLVFGLPAAAIVGLVIYLGRWWQSKRGVTPTSYVVFIFVAAAAAIPLRSMSTVLPFSQFATVGAIFFGVLRFMVMLGIVMAVSGAVVARLQEQIQATQQALRLVRDQQMLMLEADEAARRQVATLLHDRVQAGLIAACLELQVIAQRQSPEEQQHLRVVIERLEELRALDVRRAARALSPSLEDVDLQSALEELAAQYEPSVDTKVRVDDAIEDQRADLGPEIPLAVYRIVEQALLNAVTHGQAQHVHIGVSRLRDRLVIRVSDDGRGLSTASQETGLGSAVIETWTRELQGSWSLTSGRDGGALLTAHLALTPPSRSHV